MVNKQIRQFPLIYTGVYPKTIIGWGAHQTVGDECKAANIKKAMIVTTGLKGTGIVEEINEILTHNGISVEIYNKITSNPKDHEIMMAYQAFKDAECDGVVSVGGGSAHDPGKAVRALAANDGRSINEFAALVDPPWMEEMKKFKPITVPQIAVTTTAGTGAESSHGGVFTDTKNRIKRLFFPPGAVSTAAIVDPLLVRSMPSNLAAQTGFDAMSHAIEPFVSCIQVPTSKAISWQLIRIVSENIREFTYNRMNDKACENMCWAATMGGTTITFGAGAGIMHGIGHQLSALCDCHHGLGNATVAIPAERYNLPSCPERFADMAAAMGVDTRGMKTIQAADKWFDEMERLLADLNIKTGHLNEQFGIRKEDLDHIAKAYSNDLCSIGNPRAFDYEETIKLLESML